jgi:hypothetical protein
MQNLSGQFNRKKLVFMPVLLLALTAVACATKPDANGGNSAAAAASLNTVIQETAAYFTELLPQNRKLSVLGFEADTRLLADYIIEEFSKYLGEAGKFTLIERQTLGFVEQELVYQNSGEVSDEFCQRIGHMDGPETILYGRLSPLGENFRLVMYATDVETAKSRLQTRIIEADEILASLLDAENAGSVDAVIDRALMELGRGISSRTTVAMGKISLRNAYSATDFSSFLTKRISYSAAEQSTKFRLVDSDAEAIQAFVEGNFLPRGTDVEVILNLVSAGDKSVLGTSKFIISGSELAKYKLSVYPPRGDTYMTREDIEKQVSILDYYEKSRNAFGLTVTPDRPDTIYHDGDYMYFTVYAEKDCYITITQVDVYANAKIMYPKPGRDDGFIKAGETRRIPDKSRFRVLRPYGIEYILVAAYDEPIEIRQEKAAALSSEVLSRLLEDVPLENSDAALSRPGLSPSATALFSYSILAKN